MVETWDWTFHFWSTETRILHRLKAVLCKGRTNIKNLCRIFVFSSERIFEYSSPFAYIYDFEV